MGAWVLALWLAACAATEPYVAPEFRDAPAPADTTDSPVVSRVFLVGNTGAGSEAPSRPTLEALRRQADSTSALVFLGNALPDVPRRSGTSRPDPASEPILALGRDFPGRVVVLPGRIDWGRGGRSGVERQENRVEAALDRDDAFVPDDAFPGPVEIELTDDAVLLAIDTSWWLVDGEKAYGDYDESSIETPADLLLQLDDLIKKHHDRRVLVVGHHPTQSNGRYGGYFPLRTHLFPLTEIWRDAYLPLPLLGSLYPLFRRYVGQGPQDLAHPRYGSLRRGLEQIFAQHESLVYAASHDTGLQVFPSPEGGPWHVVSGGGGGPGYVRRGQASAFAYGGAGFAVLTYHADGTVWLETWGTSPESPSAERLFRIRVAGPFPEEIDAAVELASPRPDYRDSVVVRSINPAYRGNRVTRTLFGRNYRQAWAVPVAFPVLDLAREAGGLTPIKRGGSAQTRSLRLENADGRQYVLRSVDKTFHSFQSAFEGTLAAELAQEQTSILHPFAAVTTARLAHAAGLYHAEPRLVYVPDDPLLGIYREDFGDQVMILEARPTNDMSDAPEFGASDEVIGYRKLFEEITDDNDHRVDARMYARARLFDVWVSDWDRHEDQWRWAAFEPFEVDSTLEGEARTEGKVYRPIPRDRDWALGRFDGLLSPLVSRLKPEYQYFGPSWGSVTGLTLKGREQDRRFLAELTREDWAAVTDSLQARLSDAVIDEAIRLWPDTLFALDGNEVARILKKRRDELDEATEEFYAFHVHVVDVVGSDKHERFEVRRAADTTTVTVYRTTKEGETRGLYYRRPFVHGETSEVRLYGLDGDDRFEVEGAARGGPRVIAVGGPGEDAFVDRSDVGRRGPHTHFYDTPEGNQWDVQPETQVRTSTDPNTNLYDPKAYRPDSVLPRISVGINSDDGVLVGGGAVVVRNGFQKNPYDQQHQISGTIASNRWATTLAYRGAFADALYGLDVEVGAGALLPGNFINFYGLGNDTDPQDRSVGFYHTDIEHIDLQAGFRLRRPRGLTLRTGSFLEWSIAHEDPDRFVGQPRSGLEADDFRSSTFAGLNAGLTLESVDRLVNPRQGYRWTNDVAFRFGLRDRRDGYNRLASTFTFYVSPFYAPQLTIAGRIGAAHNTGVFPFYRANTLGGETNLRGYRKTRYAGRSSAFANAEVRTKLFNYRTYLAIGELGVLGFYDTGRVWADGEHSDRWHSGYGGGLWTNLFNAFVLSGTIAISPEDRTFAVRMGYFF